jgi:hypothetical protein
MAPGLLRCSRLSSPMSKHTKASCNDCYFRREALCALPGDAPCPTFRSAATSLAPPRQPRLVLRQPTPVTAGTTA